MRAFTTASLNGRNRNPPGFCLGFIYKTNSSKLLGEFVGLPEYKPCLIDIPAARFLDEFIVGPEPVNQAVRRKTDDAVGNGIDEFVVV